VLLRNIEKPNETRMISALHRGMPSALPWATRIQNSGETANGKKM
jgi:hypothetical protein